MNHDPLEIIQLSWQSQAQYLQQLSLTELESLLFRMNFAKANDEDKNGFERLWMAVISVLQDHLEKEGMNAANPFPRVGLSGKGQI